MVQYISVSGAGDLRGGAVGGVMIEVLCFKGNNLKSNKDTRSYSQYYTHIHTPM